MLAVEEKRPSQSLTQTTHSQTELSSTQYRVDFLTAETLLEVGNDVLVRLFELISRAFVGVEHFYKVDDIVKKTLDGRYLVWVILKDDSEIVAAALTEVSTFPSQDALCVLAIGGDDMKGWLALYNDALKQYAKQIGVDSIICCCRDGFVRALKPLGWEKRTTTMELDVHG